MAPSLHSSWKKLFCHHANDYKVLDHIDETPTLKETDPTYLQCVEIDALVFQWIYNTLSDELMVWILENDTTTQDAWNKVKAKFLNNKGSRGTALEQEFSNLTLAACSQMEAYFHKLKDLADILGDFITLSLKQESSCRWFVDYHQTLISLGIHQSKLSIIAYGS